MATNSPTIKRPKTKIVCTLGPATESEDTIRALVERGMSVARLNLSHGTLDQHATAIERVRGVSKQLDIPVGVMVDVPGPKYRIGPLAPETIELKPGDKLTLTSEDVAGTEERVSVTPPGIHRDATVGHPILVNDGLIELRALKIQGSEVICEVVAGGSLTERRGVATPGKAPSQPFPDRKAAEALKFAANFSADFVALSSIAVDTDVHVARGILREHELDGYIISKIERVDALENFDGILEASDSIMVARGDLGTEVPLARVPIIQKELISKCNIAGKPVITATQMLESMVHSSVPTRAEVTDVANAVFDGTDAIMLSQETSVGQYPLESTGMMAQVAEEAENALPYYTIVEGMGRYRENKTDDAISYDACQTALQLNASLIVAFTESGSTASRVSKYRPPTPILALTPHDHVQRRLTLIWGVTPVTVDNLGTVDDFFAKGEEQAAEVLGNGSGSLVVLVAGLPIGVSGSTNLLKVLTIR